jgi:uncharacterized membrane protein YbhN (UPF0104 family)
MREQVVNGVSGRSGFIIRLFGTLLAIGLLIYLLSQQGWGEIVLAVKQIPPAYLALSLLLMFVSRFSVTGRWHVLLRSGGLNIALGQSLRITFSGLFATNFLPTTVGGDVIRLAGAMQLGFDGAISAASLVVDRLVGMTGMAMMLPFGLPALVASRTSQSDLLNSQRLYLMGILPASIMKWLQRAWDKGIRIVRRIVSALSLWLKQPRALLISLGFSWINMLCLFAILWLLFKGQNEEIPFLLIGGLYSLVYFVTLLPFSINGYGIQELSMTFIFAQVAGVSMQSSLTVALLFRTLMMIASLPGAAFVPGLMAGAKSQTRTVE